MNRRIVRYQIVRYSRAAILDCQPTTDPTIIIDKPIIMNDCLTGYHQYTSSRDALHVHPINRRIRSTVFHCISTTNCKTINNNARRRPSDHNHVIAISTTRFIPVNITT